MQYKISIIVKNILKTLNVASISSFQSSLSLQV